MKLIDLDAESPRNAEGYCPKCGGMLGISGQCVACAVANLSVSQPKPRWWGCYGVQPDTNGHSVYYVTESRQKPVDAITQPCADEVTAMLEVGAYKQRLEALHTGTPLSEWDYEELRDMLFFQAWNEHSDDQTTDDIILELAERIKARRG